MLMLALCILYARLCPSVRSRVVRMAIAPQDRGACGDAFRISIRLTRLKGGSGGTGRL